MSHAHVGIIPFSDTPVARPVNPLKLYEYCACGLPVVAKRLPEMARMESPAILADSAEDFARTVSLTLDRTSDGSFDREALRAYARANTWENRIDTVMELLGINE